MAVDLLAWALLACAVILGVPVVVFFLQVVSAIRPGRILPQPLSATRPRVAVLVPAHDESSGIEETCRLLQSQLAAGDRLLVVADNCSDDTAAKARDAGAEVVERHDATGIGKGFALDFGVRHLQADAPEVVLVVDADCRLGIDAVDRLVRSAFGSGRPVQAAYIMRNQPEAPLRMRIAEFAGIVKNLVRPLGYHRMGLPCMLMGTGMAFTWPAISGANLATGHIVEDMKLGVDLACAGTPPAFCPYAEVVSYFPGTLEGFAVQRKRWEHGHLGVILSDAPALLGRGVARGELRLVAMALDLAVPPLALLAMLVLAGLGASAAVALLFDARAPLWAHGTVFLLLLIGVVLAWARHGRPIVSAFELAFAPVYALMKIPMYLHFLYRKQVAWVRSARK